MKVMKLVPPFIRTVSRYFRTPLVQKSATYPYRDPFITLGESSLNMRSVFQVSGVCFATDGDDCSIDNPADSDMDGIPNSEDAFPTDQSCTP